MRFNLSLKYIVTITLILLLVIGLTFRFILKKHEQLVVAQLDMQAKALFKQVVITRRWVAEHGGVYIQKLPWVEPNPFLRNAAITDVSGKRYVKENPAMVTKQLSRYAEREQLYLFHITSLKLLNPDNAPDAFETAALRSFESKTVTEASSVDKIGNAWYYRYIAPLYVEKACLECHSKQGYKVGDIRGAISVSIPMDYARSMIAAERKYMIAGTVGGGILLIAALYFITRRLVIIPIKGIQANMSLLSKGEAKNFSLLATGDEIEDLSRSFSDMARELDEYHSCLQEKIRGATQELTAKNEELLRLSRSKSDFIARTSHELRTPLTAIKGAMDYLSIKLANREADEDRDLQVFFEMIKKNADRLIRLVNNVLEYERIELGAHEMNFSLFNLKEAFQEVIAQITPLAEQKQVAIRMKAMDVITNADEDRMKQVMTNLLSNALSFSPPSSKIQVTLQCRDESVDISVEDQGPGVPESDREHIFKQFYSKNVKEGTGLGLAICKGIVEAHGGTIGVECGSKCGSRFWFKIPRERKVSHEYEKTTACDR